MLLLFSVNRTGGRVIRGAYLGLCMAVFLSLIATVISLTEGAAGLSDARPAYKIYFLGGIGAGALFGVLHGLIRSAIASVLLGAVLAVFVYFTAAILIWGNPEGWGRSAWLAAIVPGAIAGPGLGLYFWRKRKNYRFVSDFLEFG